LPNSLSTWMLLYISGKLVCRCGFEANDLRHNKQPLCKVRRTHRLQAQNILQNIHFLTLPIKMVWTLCLDQLHNKKCLICPYSGCVYWVLEKDKDHQVIACFSNTRTFALQTLVARTIITLDTQPVTLGRPTTTRLFKECNLDMIGNLDLNF